MFQRLEQECDVMKSTLLLTTALFLVSAPSPDSKSISEFSGGFLADTDEHVLMAAEVNSDRYRMAVPSTPVLNYASLEKLPTKLNPDTHNETTVD